MYLLLRGHSPAESTAPGERVTWRYRGQVRPTHRLVTVEIEVTRAGAGVATADGWLWVDGTRIYEARNLSVRLTPR